MRGFAASLCHSMSLSPFLPLSLWGKAVNNAGGLADLCEPEALRKAGVPGGDRQKRGGGAMSVQHGGRWHTGARRVWMMKVGCVPGEHAGHNPPTHPPPPLAPRHPLWTPQNRARSPPQGPSDRRWQQRGMGTDTEQKENSMDSVACDQATWQCLPSTCEMLL